MTITRFAPSPTGYLHIGNLRAALFNYLIARKAGGTFILRLDDTDKERSRPEYADGIQQDLEWLGLTWDRIERQSDRLERYAAAADTLRGTGRLYECFETPTELDLKRKTQRNMGKPPVYDRSALNLTDAERTALRASREGYWRFLLDQERIEWNDGILGPQSIDAASLSDPVLIRADGQVLYTHASVVDDIDMGITHVVRGMDHVTNTAVQAQIMRALGAQPPEFAHHSMLTGPDGEGLSKRLGALSLRDLRAAGVEPMAILSLMARLGSSNPVQAEIDIAALRDGFEPTHFSAAPTRFDPADLTPLSAKVLHRLSVDDVAEDLDKAGVPKELQASFWAAVGPNLTQRAEIVKWWTICRDGAASKAEGDEAALWPQAMNILPDFPYDEHSWSAWTGRVAAATGRKGKALFHPLRRLATGEDKGPDMKHFMPLLQKPISR
ncbi:glutamate--tRNA ligase [Abyssibius alkaniclasticus]|uniref:glutamate--tRNA ligase n=1 Tax=Abyssibius alkaniclasticus TaxID=2881234 RepID=UPI0040580FEF